MSSRRERSRSPVRSESRRRDKNHDHSKNNSDVTNQQNMMNQMMLNNMYQQGNMLMATGMYPNMMMSGAMLGGGMISSTNMDMVPATGMEMIPQTQVDMTTMANQGMTAMGNQGMTAMTNQGMTALANQSMAAMGAQGMGAIGNQGLSAMGTQAIAAMGNQGMAAMGNQALAAMGNQGLANAGTTYGTQDMSLMGSVMMDPSMMGMYSNMTGEMQIEEERKEIVLKYCKLTPPPPGTPKPPCRVRPLGCRTIFVGGLPDKIRESIVRDIFGPYGRIHTLRLSKKNFCHIRYDRESSVDSAMFISGYRIKITDTRDKDKDKNDTEDDDDSPATTGWLHVDFALSRDDQNEYERRQRQVLRAQEAQLQQLSVQQELVNQQISTSRRHSPSPARIQPFSNTAIVQLAEKIKTEDHFASNLPTLLAWLERGECSKKNSNQFYSMIQATNSHIRRLFNEKMQAEEELMECREKVKGNIEKVIQQLEQVAKVFAAATHQRVWDHFTKPQRKNIETWQKMTQEFNALKEEFLEKFCNEDNEYNGFYNNKITEVNNEELQELKRENESLQFQLEAYKNEVDVIKADAQKDLEKFKAQFIARQALQGNIDKNPPLPAPVVKPPPPPPLPDDMDNKIHLKKTIEAGCGEAKLIGVMSAFLQVHPQGASLEYVVSYVRALFPHSTQATVHHVLQKHPDVFQRNTSGIGANIESRWVFVGFNNAE